MNLDHRLLHLARQHQFTLALAVGLGTAGGVFTVLQAGLLSQIVSQVFINGASLPQNARRLGLLLAVIGLRALLSWSSEQAASAAARRLKTDLRRRLFAHLYALGPGYLRGERTGELINTAVEGVQALDAYFSQYLPQLALAALVPVTFLMFVFPLDWLSGVVLLATAPLIPLFMVLIGSLAQVLTRRQWQSLSRMSAYFLDVLQGLTTLKILGRSRAQTETIAQVSERYRETTMEVLRITFLSALVLELVTTLSTAVVAVEVGLRLLYGRLAFEQAFFVLLLAPEFYLPLRLLGTRFHAGMSGREAAQRIFEVLAIQPAGTPAGQAAPERPAQGSLRPTALRPGAVIRFEEVVFHYPDDRPALNGVSFQIAGGQTVALVGPSGAGKTTAAHLFMQFLQPQAGQILMDETPLSTLAPEDWRGQIAWVPQHPYLFHDTVRNNIRLACPEASQEQVVWAARQANADAFIQALPQGYDTLIGERGARLSGGQAQRIALARAFLKDAPLLILDEATSSLDPENERLVQQAIQRLLAGGRTGLIIAHRLETAAQADWILVMDQGRVVEQGTHLSLLAQNGLYRRMVRTGSGGREPGSAAGAAEAAGVNRPPTETVRELSTSPTRLGPAPAAPATGAKAGSPLPVLLRLLKMVLPFKGWAALAVLLGYATIASGVGLMALSAYIISAAALQPSIALLQVPIVGVRFFGITRGLFRYLERYTAHQITFRLLAKLRVWFYRSLEPLAPARLADHRSGDLLARITGDIQSLENFYVRVLAPPLVALLVALTLSAFLAGYAAALALTLVVFLILAGVGVPLLMGALSRRPGVAEVNLRARLSTAAVDGIQGMGDLLAHNQEERYLARLGQIGGALAGAQRQMAQLNSLQNTLVNLLAHLCLWTLLALAIPMVRQGQFEGVYLAVVVLAAQAGFEAVLPLPAAAQYLKSNLHAARRLFEIADAPPAVLDPPAPLPLPDEFSLRVRGLRFRYPEGTPQAPGSEPVETGPGPSTPAPSICARPHPAYALHGVDFDLPAGKHMAVVGPSGSGKTTLIHLLLRFWEYEGHIRLGGHELRQYSQEAVRKSLGVVPQTTYLFSGSIRENIQIARPDAAESEIIRAARLAQLHPFVQSLPDGYETWIGEQGLMLSGGERQRLSLARALLKDAPLLLFDEPTAHLDAVTEREVVRAIQSAVEGRASLTITHRLVGMEWMDEILVLDAGQVVERGTHAALLARHGLYRQMWDLQTQVLTPYPVEAGLTAQDLQ